MTRVEYKREMRLFRTGLILTSIALFAMVIFLVQEKSYNAGYNDAYNTGQADGWQGCIEENNLYERYKE